MAFRTLKSEQLDFDARVFSRSSGARNPPNQNEPTVSLPMNDDRPNPKKNENWGARKRREPRTVKIEHPVDFLRDGGKQRKGSDMWRTSTRRSTAFTSPLSQVYNSDPHVWCAHPVDPPVCGDSRQSIRMLITVRRPPNLSHSNSTLHLCKWCGSGGKLEKNKKNIEKHGILGLLVALNGASLSQQSLQTAEFGVWVRLCCSTKWMLSN